MGQEITRASQYEDSPEGWAQRWEAELKAADDEVKPWHDQGRKVERRYLDDRENQSTALSRLNLFHGDVETRKALIYGNPPSARCRRRFADALDDPARVSAEMLERLLNGDIERDGDNFATAIGMARDDRLLPGIGVNRYRYTVEWGDPTPEQPAKVDPVTGAEVAPSVPEQPTKANEDVESDYVYWQDFRWSPARFWDEVRWVAFKAPMSMDAMHKRFDEKLGPEIVETIPLVSKREDEEKKKADPWARAEVWEVWSKEHREVFWVVRGFRVILDREPDPLGLSCFFPCQRPMFANAVNGKLLPRPDFVISQDLYNEIDVLTTRIGLLEDAIKVVGFYDAASPEIAKALNGKENVMVPVKGWSLHQEKGGTNKSVDWFPLDVVVGALDKLGQKRLEKIQLLHQVNGMSDAMRGQGASGVTATQRSIEAHAAGTRTRAAQSEFATFATGGLKIRAEIIARHFDPKTIVERSNILRTKDAPLAQEAAELIKSDVAQYRIDISSDTLAQTDYEAVQGDSLQFMQSLMAGLKEITAVGAVAPQAVPDLLQLLQAGLAGFRAAARMEGIFDTLVAKAQQAAANPPPPKPDPAVEREKVKGAVQMQQAKVDMAKSGMEMQHAQAKHGMDMQKLAGEVQANRANAAVRVAEARATPPGFEED